MGFILNLIFLFFRFLVFIAGVIGGFLFALFVFPLPGKTFFNKMSKLPESGKSLIDDSISLGAAFARLMFTSYREGAQKLKETTAKIENKLRELKEKYHLDTTKDNNIEATKDIIESTVQ